MSTPFELRYKVLSDAREMLMQQYNYRQGNAQLETEKLGYQSVLVPLPDAEDIIALAEKLYVFVKTRE